jgi:uncharacterized protein (DUF2062 family)
VQTSPEPSILNRQRSFALRWRRRFRYFYLRFLRLQAHPQALTRGLAAGVFAGLFPIFGLQTLVGIVLASLVRGNKIMAAAGTWISNPFTYVPIYTFNYQVGRWILGQPDSKPFDDLESLQNWVQAGADITGVLFLGCFVVGAICSALSYGIGLPLITRAQRRYREMQHKRKTHRP